MTLAWLIIPESYSAAAKLPRYNVADMKHHLPDVGSNMAARKSSKRHLRSILHNYIKSNVI